MNDCAFSPCRNYRYSLLHVVDPINPEPGRLAMWIGLNPSKADERALDPTLRIIRNLTIMHGCARFVMTNLFAYRATNPKDMLRQLDPVGPKNDATLRRWAGEADLVVCCWGAHGCHLRRDAAVVKLLSGFDLRCITTTSKGAPHHPLRLRRTNTLPTWSMPK